jgi:zinc protease
VRLNKKTVAVLAVTVCVGTFSGWTFASSGGKESIVQPKKVRTVAGITEYRFQNGLSVVLIPDHSQPLVTTNLVYRVGSRHEHYGETGMAHLLEHLLFKPTKNFGIKSKTPTPDEVFSKLGADANATTSLDRTNYFVTFPSSIQALAKVLELEADRMINAPIRQDDLWNEKLQQGEMSVVRNEFEIGENKPIQVMQQQLQAVAYDWHNYGKDTIGARSDIEHVNVDRLRAFYKKHYRPDNATLVVAGKFDESSLLALINRTLGKVPQPKVALERTYTVEPTQEGERSISLHRAGSNPFAAVGYHIPPGTHQDMMPLHLLSEILTDPVSGRLKKSLIDTQLSTKVEGSAQANFEPGFFVIGSSVNGQNNLEKVKDTLLNEIEGMYKVPVSDSELKRAKRNLMRGYKKQLLDSNELAMELTEYVALGDWAYFFQHMKDVSTVTAQEVDEVAKKYLLSTNRTLGIFIPSKDIAKATISAETKPVSTNSLMNVEPRIIGEEFDSSTKNIQRRVDWDKSKHGIHVNHLPVQLNGDLVKVNLSLRIGSSDSLTGLAEVGELAGKLLGYATQLKSEEELEDALMDLDAELEIDGNPEHLTISLEVPKKNLDAAMKLVSEVIMQPLVTANNFEKVKNSILEKMGSMELDPGALVDNYLERSLDETLAGHVHHAYTLSETRERLSKVSLEQVQEFVRRFYGSGSMAVTFVGAVDKATTTSLVDTLFAHWSSDVGYHKVKKAEKELVANRVVIDTPGKANGEVMMATSIGANQKSEDYAAFLLASQIFAGDLSRSRMGIRIRQRDGLSYSVASESNLSDEDERGHWFVYANAAPENISRVERAMKEETARAIKNGFTKDEVEEAKQSWLESEPLSNTNLSGLANRISVKSLENKTFQNDLRLNESIRKLDVAAVNKAFRTYFSSEKMLFILAGDGVK